MRQQHMNPRSEPDIILEMCWKLQGWLVQGNGRGEVRNLGKPVELAGRYFQEGADEVTFLNITGFRDHPLQDLPMLEVSNPADSIFCLLHAESACPICTRRTHG
jgi:imidazole glycerol phosphate synthase subunit HisF